MEKISHIKIAFFCCVNFSQSRKKNLRFCIGKICVSYKRTLSAVITAKLRIKWRNKTVITMTTKAAAHWSKKIQKCQKINTCCSTEVKMVEIMGARNNWHFFCSKKGQYDWPSESEIYLFVLLSWCLVHYKSDNIQYNLQSRCVFHMDSGKWVQTQD